MSFGNTTENDLALLIFNKTALSWDANNTLYISLHTADPGEGGNQTTSECAYTSYARVAVTRNGSGGFTVTGGAVTNAALIQFPTATGGSETATYVAIGTDASGTGQILVSGALNAGLAISSGIQPQFPAGDLDFSLD